MPPDIDEPYEKFAMSNLEPQGTCQEKRGFLFKHACAHSAVYSCELCGKSVCEHHVRPTDSGFVCIACDKPNINSPNTRRSRNKHDPYDYGDRYYGHGGGYYSAYYWGSHHGSHHADDFTEADGAALAHEGSQGFEDAAGES
jgi:hypothetical protein